MNGKDEQDLERPSAQDFILSILFILSKVFFAGGQRLGWQAWLGRATRPCNLKPAFVRPSSDFHPGVIRPRSGLDPPQSDLIRPKRQKFSPTNTEDGWSRAEMKIRRARKSGAKSACARRAIYALSRMCLEFKTVAARGRGCRANS
jgi:hypothetical protein